MIGLRRAVAVLRGPKLSPGPRVFERHTRTFVAAQSLVRAYYATLLFLAFSTLPEWGALLERRNLDLLWPVAWARLVGEPAAWTLILSTYLGGTFFAAVFPNLRAARALAWLGVFEHAAILNSFGKINHGMHMTVLTAFVLLFLPDVGRSVKSAASRAERHVYLMVLGGTQALALLTYSMAGIGKLVFFVYQAAVGEYHALSPDALAIHVAEVIILTHKTPLIGPWIIDHSYLGLPLMAGMMYLQLFAFWAAFRPALHKAWGIGLVGFHIGTIVMMGILFPENVLIVGLLMFASPFAASRPWSARDMLFTLPLFGKPLRRLLEKRASSSAPASPPAA